MRIVSQIIAIAAVNLRSLGQRKGNSLVIVTGIAGVVAVLLSVLAMSMGFRQAIDSDASDDRAIVLAPSADSEYQSSLARSSLATVGNARNVRRDPRGRPLVSGETILVVPVMRKSDGSDVNVTLRGVGEQYFAVRPEMRIVAGRMIRTGTQELLVGAAALAQFAGLEIGSQVRLQDGDWTVVGVFRGDGGARDSELVADVLTVMSIYKLQTFNSITVALPSASAFQRFKEEMAADPTLAVDVHSEPEYLASASKSVRGMLRLVAYVVGSIMSLGALFGALNSMHSAVAARSVEIATLRAIGFGSGALVVAILLEALLLALVGAAAGVAIAYLAFNGAVISTLGGAVWDSQLVYALRITPALVAFVVALACGLGLIGGIVPALRAARENVADALRSV
ncbi:MAG TPA: ABC transporter permease [Povalibacter sp.]|uniref:ABC transporter permease n=1 Tax=Povalibacter sp. TaxID=1962978 RepID=UPI002CCDE10D|nr:ABC transporter permease [Povalibacter sp.]HMN45195.1 ABC transporter permease [Povalibacter sp.]